MVWWSIMLFTKYFLFAFGQMVGLYFSDPIAVRLDL